MSVEPELQEPEPGRTMILSAPKKLSSRHRLMVWMAANGRKQKDVVTELGMSNSRVSVIFSSKRFQLAVKNLQMELFGEDARDKFKRSLPKAIDTAYDIMIDINEKGATRLSAANVFMDRAMGKPQQEIKLGGSLLEKLFTQLDGIKDEKPIKELENVEYTEVHEIEEEEEEIDEIDKWAKENL